MWCGEETLKGIKRGKMGEVNSQNRYGPPSGGGWNEKSKITRLQALHDIDGKNRGHFHIRR